MKDLLLCAIHRIGHPSTASEVLDKAIALALDANWPKHHMPTNVHKVSRMLRNMVAARDIAEAEPKKEDGNLRPTYRPARDNFYADCDIPDPPNDEPKQHPITTLSQHQQITLFDSFQATLELLARQGTERSNMDNRHLGEQVALWERWRIRLTAAGLDQ